jgi:chondroitin 4-sulfotransferase 11
MNDKELFLIPIPRVASTALRRVWGHDVLSKECKYINPFFVGFCYQHYTAYECRKFIGDYYSFCFVRNPWDRLVSAYKWSHKMKRIGEEEIGFDEFVAKHIANEEYCEWRFQSFGEIFDRRKHRYRHLMSQTTFIYDLKGNSMVDFIGRFEKFNEDFDILRNEFGLSKSPIGISNKSKDETDYREFYTDETKKAVGKYFEEDVDNFKYTF